MTRRRLLRPFAVLVALAVSALIVACEGRAALPPPALTAQRPNVVVIMTDDQTVADLRVMSRTRALLAGEGVTFDRSFATYPVCAPSRATFLSGQFAHNNDVMGLEPPSGGYARFDNDHALPVWLQHAGYRTAHIGKYINGYGVTPQLSAQPAGWNDWHGLLGQATYRMWGYTLDENGERRTVGRLDGGSSAQYQTNELTRLATGVIRRHAGQREPLFLSVAYVAPHHEEPRIQQASGRLIRPAPDDDRERLHVPRRSPAFDERDTADKPYRVQYLPRLGRADVATIDGHVRDREASLQAVDRGVARIVAELKRTGQLDHTYIVFTSDNGFMNGEHRVRHGKMLPYDPSTRVPLLIRGPGLPAGTRSRAVVGNVDLAPTILALAGARADRSLDGISLVPFARHPDRLAQRALLLEAGGSRYAWNAPTVDGRLAVRRVLTYRAVRTDRWLFVRYGDGERELYDAALDPDQLVSRAADPRYAATRDVLEGLADRLARCSGAGCAVPAPRIPAP